MPENIETETIGKYLDKLASMYFTHAENNLADMKEQLSKCTSSEIMKGVTDYKLFTEEIVKGFDSAHELEKVNFPRGKYWWDKLQQLENKGVDAVVKSMLECECKPKK